MSASPTMRFVLSVLLLGACAQSAVDGLENGVSAPDAGAGRADGGVSTDGRALPPVPDAQAGLPCERRADCAATLQLALGGSRQAINGGEVANYNHNCVVKSGDLYCWGSNSSGQVGNGTTTRPAAPARVLQEVHEVSAGGLHTCAVRTDGSLWCWGANGFGQLGASPATASLPTQIMSGVVSVSAGDTHTCAVKQDSTLWCWGSNARGQANPQSTATTVTAPVQVGSDYVTVSAGLAHACGIKTDASLWCWGSNEDSQLGLGTTSTQEAPARVAASATIVRAGARSSAFVDGSGAVRVMGVSANGQLGLGTTERAMSPTLVPGLVNAKSLALGARGYHVCAVADGGLFCWGWGDVFPIGSATPASGHVTSPQQVAADAVTVSVGRASSCYARANGEVFCWGAPNTVYPGPASTTLTPVKDPVLIPVP